MRERITATWKGFAGHKSSCVCRSGYRNSWEVFFVKQKCGDSDGVLIKSIIDCLRLTREVRDGVWDGRFGFQINFCKAPDLFSGLFLTSMLQKRLHLAGGEGFVSTKVSTEKGSTQNLAMSGLPTAEVTLNTCKPGKKTLNQRHRRMIKGFKRKKSLSERVDGVKVKAGQHSPKTSGAAADQTMSKRAKMAADAMRTSSFWVKHSAADAAECESGQRINDSSVSIQTSSKGALQLNSASDAVYLTTGSPSNLRYESILCPTSTAENELRFRPQLNGEQSFSHMSKDSWIDSNMASYYSRVLDRRKHKGESSKPICPVYNDVSHLLTRHPGKRGRPRLQGSDQTSPSCSANLLITKGDRGWREPDVKVELQSSSSECLIAVQSDGGKMYTHKVQQNVPIGKTNRHTRAVMWKGGNSWTLEFQDRKQWNLFKNMYEECGHRKAQAATFKQIPIPGVRQVDNFDGMNLPGTPFHRSPYGYIRQTEGEVESALMSTHIIYDLDSEDEAWLTEIIRKSNNVDHSSSKSLITEENLERIMDKLEKIAYMRRGVLAAADEAIEICQDWGSAAVVMDVYTYWSKKRLTKGTALVRQFQPPLWEQYQKQLQNWQSMSNELQLRLPSASKEQVLEQCPRPPMFSFCLPPRGLDANTLSKKLQKQRSQRKLSAVFKYPQASSLSDSSEESHRVPMLRLPQGRVHQQLLKSSLDPDWHPSSQSRPCTLLGYRTTGRQKNTSQCKSYEQVLSGLDNLNTSDYVMKVGEVHAQAAVAREVAGNKAFQSQRQFLKFDAALQRAAAALMELEAIRFAELAVVDQDRDGCFPSVLDNQLPILKEKVGLLSRQFSNLLGKEIASEYASKDQILGCLVGSRLECCDDGNTLCKVDTQAEDLEKVDPKQCFIADADALLPMPGMDPLDAWMGTTLLQRPDKVEEMSIRLF